MITLIILIAILGLLVYMIESFVPMPQPFKIAIRVIVVLGLVLYLIRIFAIDIPLR